MHPAALDEDSLLKLCRITTTRRQGPGGQHRNKVESAVIVSYEPTGMIAEASERRSQADNRAVALFRLRLALAITIRESNDSDSPTSLWFSRVEKNQIKISESHNDFPAMLAEAIDTLCHCQWRTNEAAVKLGVSGSQLVRLLRKHPPALLAVNQQRAALGLEKLR